MHNNMKGFVLFIILMIGVFIHRLKDLAGRTSTCCSWHTVISYYNDGRPAYFDNVADGIYDYVNDNGYSNLGKWVEAAVK